MEEPVGCPPPVLPRWQQEVEAVTAESTKYWQKLASFGSRPGLERIRKIMNRLGDPHLRFRVVHVAGTNGKGSTCAMVASVLQEAGYKTGLFTSPHLVRYNERFRINGQEITDGDLEYYGRRVWEVVDDLSAAGDSVTQFEFTTAVGLLYFAEQNVDAAVIEVGLGGRLDATNIVQADVSVITHISYDHTEVLGETLAAIAREKAGIIHPHGRVIVAPQAEEARAAIFEAAAERNARVVYLEKTPNAVEMSASGTTLVWPDGVKVRLPLPGVYQVTNAAVVRAVVDELARLGWDLDQKDFVAGMERVKWPGRLEVIEGDPPVVLDGAHNIDGIQMLRASLDRLWPDSRLVYVFALTGRKPLDEILPVLDRPGSAFVFTAPRSYRQVPSSPDTLAAAAIAAGVAPERIAACPDLPAALELAMEKAGKTGVVCVCGSLYLVGEAKAVLESS